MICFPLRGGFPLPGGWVAARRLLAPPQAGLAARRDSSGCDPAARWGRGPSVSAQDRVTDTPARSARRVPAASGDIAAPPAGRIFSPTQKEEKAAWEGGIQSAGAAGGRSLRSPRAPRVRIGAGRRWPEAQRREQRGSRRRGALRGHGRRSLQAQCAGAHKPAASHRGTGKTKASRSETREIQPAGQEKTPTEWKNRTAPATRGAREERGPGFPGPPDNSVAERCHRFMKTVVGSPDASSTTEAHTITPEPELTVTFA